ncbi:hypothetical protein F442_13088 [Phytophthora nicotianae P10297]|uniref:Uncharacterized protein n=4 Tax=Phytophthora nicotianae TaxID=4792 RepID=W2R4K6_PHYN3|nr:hypothetical protein PPTG_21250 [Phytophthora nicotianae INRA-310]ETI41558.1 hypothetical protein F443_13219 [Phytophthora nicotianae P1569]ETL88248.1 hypothetical protein L917_12661 [Phytophthora nicotianae]ETP39447.1 hypothetical protein F442_13088 [Phytophthora nicotianae P10297]ETM41513.1 hypothetical protein L914_12720 [Phytophthora nicotianae]ETN20196.1 hypothetical protein PPTG_21250 [Phytophthora nicotianae INRA-310]
MERERSLGKYGRHVNASAQETKKNLPVELKEVEIPAEVKEINDNSVKPTELIGDAEIDK